MDFNSQQQRNHRKTDFINLLEQLKHLQSTEIESVEENDSIGSISDDSDDGQSVVSNYSNLTQTKMNFFKQFFQKDRFSNDSPSMIKKQIAEGNQLLKLQVRKFQKLKNKQSTTHTCQVLRSACHWSLGLLQKNTELSIQIAYLSIISDSKHFIYLENQFFMSGLAGTPLTNQIAEAILLRIKKAAKNQQNFHVFIFIPLLPGFEGEIDDPGAGVMQIQMHWQYQTLSRGGNSLIQQLLKDPNVGNPDDYLTIIGLRTHDKINDKPITEIVYLHSKMILVDDRVAIIGSANINDRSMSGDRDSEIGLIIEDQDQINSVMNGESYQAGKFAYTLRCNLMMEVFGIQQNDEIRDPLNRNFINQLKKTAKNNTQIYRQVFACYPDDGVKNLQELDGFKKQKNLELYDQVKKEIQGFAVEWPLQFLANENLEFQITTQQYYCPQINFT